MNYVVIVLLLAVLFGLDAYEALLGIIIASALIYLCG